MAGKLATPGRGVVPGGVDAVVQGDGAVQGRVEDLGAAGVPGPPLDRRVLGAAAGAGEQEDAVAGVREPGGRRCCRRGRRR
ncbi:hypothetical protein [Nocardioides convexus]|uniref:hypothetical protein n=1 Tax=Nocardioides convexus TaxID=2712224 RepID=UPI002418281E|nr:hypothetical protein [Nocardioides convexus]